MKCVKTAVDTIPVQVKKVSDEQAGLLVDTGSWEYTSKSVYKRIKAQQEGGDKNTTK